MEDLIAGETSRRVSRVHAEKDLVERIKLRLEILPLSYLATTEARSDLVALVEKYEISERTRKEEAAW